MRWRTAPGPATVRVPQLVGLRVRAAQDLILDTGLLPAQHQPRRGAPAPVQGFGLVVRQSPAAGRSVRRSSRMMIWVDSGPSGPEDGGEEGAGTSRAPISSTNALSAAIVGPAAAGRDAWRFTRRGNVPARI